MIGVLLDTQFGHGLEILQGVRDFAARHPTWQLLPLHSAQEQMLGDFLGHGRLDGLIGALLSDRWLEGLPGRRVPMINVGDASALHRVPSVVTDNYEVGRRAARHLLDNGQRVFGCLHAPSSLAARQRRDGFVATVSAAGLTVSEPASAESYAPDAAWPAWLAELLTPCALFCGGGFPVRRLMNHLRARGARVPDDFAVVGVGDLALDSILSGVALSAVPLPGRRIGWCAAARLESALRGDLMPADIQLVPPDGLEIRASSALLPGGDPLVARALALMQQQASQPLDIAVLARRCGASRRTLELRFRRVLGRGPAAEQRRRRLATACRLLSESALSLTAVAEATGFRDVCRFSTAFRQATGRPPGAWRTAARVAEE